jgi:hypothetical protein
MAAPAKSSLKIASEKIELARSLFDDILGEIYGESYEVADERSLISSFISWLNVKEGNILMELDAEIQGVLSHGSSIMNNKLVSQVMEFLYIRGNDETTEKTIICHDAVLHAIDAFNNLGVRDFAREEMIRGQEIDRIRQKTSQSRDAYREQEKKLQEEKNDDEKEDVQSVYSIRCPTCRKTGNVELPKHVIHGCSDPVPKNYEGDKSICVACIEKWADVFFVGCGHNVMCQGCVIKMAAQEQ